MSRRLSFVYLDGREVEGSTPREIVEALRASEDFAPEDLASYLDLLGRRGQAWSVPLDVGRPEEEIDVRCRRVLAGLIRHGWLRPSAAPVTWPPRPRPRPVGSAAAPPKFQTSAA